MTTLLLIRHGQSVSNLRGIFTGNLDLELTRQGLDQAACTARYILNSFHVDAVYASDLCRAVDTARAVAEPLGLPVRTDRRLREIWAGDWEGRSFDDLTQTSPAYKVWRTDIGNCITDGGESIAQLSSRVVEAVADIAKANDGKTVVIATHATPIRALQCHCEGKDLAQMKDVPWVTNASVTTVIYEDGRLQLREACHDGHLGQQVSRFPANV